MEALIEYGIESRMRDVMDVTVTVEAPSIPGFSRQIQIDENNLSDLQTVEVSYCDYKRIKYCEIITYGQYSGEFDILFIKNQCTFHVTYSTDISLLFKCIHVTVINREVKHHLLNKILRCLYY